MPPLRWPHSPEGGISTGWEPGPYEVELVCRRYISVLVYFLDLRQPVFGHWRQNEGTELSNSHEFLDCGQK